jgi:hypothetical protein
MGFSLQCILLVFILSVHELEDVWGGGGLKPNKTIGQKRVGLFQFIPSMPRCLAIDFYQRDER